MHDHLSSKDLLFQNMVKYCDSNKIDVFKYLPMQFVIDFSSKSFTAEIETFCQFFNCIEKVKHKNSSKSEDENEMNMDDQLDKINTIIKANKMLSDKKPIAQKNKNFKLYKEMYNGSNIWLIKPRDFNRGRGVKLFNSLENLRNLITEFTQTQYNDKLYHLITIGLNAI